MQTRDLPAQIGVRVMIHQGPCGWLYRGDGAFRRGIEAANRGDVEPLLHDAAEDLLFLPAGSVVEGAYLGRDGVRRFWADNAESFEVFRVELDDVHEHGDSGRRIGTLRIRGPAGRVETDVPVATVATYEDGKLTRFEDFWERRLALESVGLRE